MDVASWPLATKFTLGPDVSFRCEAEVSWETKSAGSVENDPTATLGWGRRLKP